MGAAHSSRRHHGKKGPSKRPPRAAVYRGAVACNGCAESVAKLLRDSPLHYEVQYVGPHEKRDINAKTLKHLDVFAWPGGGDDVNEDFKTVAHYKDAIQAYVRHGGRYLGICMGAFLARGGSDASGQTFLGLLPNGSYIASERFEPGAQVRSANDTIIEVDWTWQSDLHKGQLAKDQWMYFQDGAVMKYDSDLLGKTNVVGRYSATQNIAAAITPYGKGYVGLIGAHPEADQSWYDGYGITNPQNVSFAVGFDFIQALHFSGLPAATLP